MPLFYLSVHKDMTVAEIFSLGWGEGEEAWGWRRHLFTWEEYLVGEFRSLISNVIL